MVCILFFLANYRIGVHKDHEVQTIRKAYPAIRGQVEDMLMSIGSKLNELQGNEEQLEKRKIELVENTQSIKHTISYSFEEIRQRINKKEAQLLQNADIFMNENTKDVDTCIRLVESRAQSIKSTADYLQSQLDSMDEVCQFRN